MTRRATLSAMGSIGLLAMAGCSRTAELTSFLPPVEAPPRQPAPAVAQAEPPPVAQEQTASIHPDPVVDDERARERQMYASFTDEGFTLPAIPIDKLNAKHLRRLVTDPTGEAPGTIVVHLKERQLYLVQENGDAIRYGVSIGKDGFVWSGRAQIHHGRKWPTWTPPTEMVARKPQLAKFAGGQPGGLDNPLGARALYIFKDGHDTLFRIHGTPEWRSIGKAASSGCVRMINQDVIDLYDRVMTKGAGNRPIVVIP